MTLLQAVVTPEMIAAGLHAEPRALSVYGVTISELIAAYRAMHAVASVELVSEGERHVSRQIELLQVRNRVLEAREVECARERDASRKGLEVARENADYWYDRFIRRAREDAGLDAEIATLRTELMAARDTIAKLTPSVVPDTPSAAPNPFREFGGDRRRVGSG